jgi:triacylglycerol lipase
LRLACFRGWTGHGRLIRLAVVAALAGVAAAGAQIAPPAHESASTAAERDGVGDGRELVVLVHGMGRSPVSMWLLEQRLEHDGYRVVRFGYRSTRGNVTQLGAALGRRAGERAGDAPRVHFVGHSLGTVVIRSMLVSARPERLGRVVMLAPPNQGSASADRWAQWVAWAMPHIRELSTSPRSTARTLALPHGVEVGIIAGARDRKVRVAETYLAGASDHRVVDGFHSWLMNRTDVHRLIVQFLRAGRFPPPEPLAEAA